MDEFEKREKRDLALYKHFCRIMGASTDNIRVPRDKFSQYDACHNGYFLEYKSRESYTYSALTDVSIDEVKIDALKNLYEKHKDNGCRGSKVIVFYPLSDNVVVIDVHRIMWNRVLEGKYDCNNLYIWKHEKRFNRQTAVSKEDKVDKMVYAFPLPWIEQLGCVSVYNAPGLGEEYRRLNAELGISV